MPWWMSGDDNGRTVGRKLTEPGLDAVFEGIDRSLQAAERAYRDKLENDMARAQALLLDAVLALDGRVINDRLLTDPNYLANLTLDDWANLLREARAGGRVWQSAAAIEKCQAEARRLKMENDQLRQRLAIISPPAPLPEQTVPDPSAAVINPPPAPARLPVLPAFSAPLSAAIHLPSVPAQPPVRFARHFATESWPRSAQFLVLLALTGWSHQEALVQTLSRQLGVTTNSGTTGRLLKRLTRDGFINRQVLAVFGGKAVMVTLSDSGRDLALDMGFPPVEAEWNRLRQQRPDMGDTQAALVCLFAFRARQRGFATQVAPAPVADEAAGDVLLKDAAGTTCHVLVEVDPSNLRQALWRRLAAQQGLVALCTATPESLQPVVAAARAAGLAGRAADLAGLRTQAEDVLWTATWSAAEPTDGPRFADDE